MEEWLHNHHKQVILIRAVPRRFLDICLASGSVAAAGWSFSRPPFSVELSFDLFFSSSTFFRLAVVSRLDPTAAQCSCEGWHHVLFSFALRFSNDDQHYSFLPASIFVFSFYQIPWLPLFLSRKRYVGDTSHLTVIGGRNLTRNLLCTAFRPRGDDQMQHC